jgi:peptidoglycan/LPS O-acetylase OafA/YrhL
VNTLKERYHAQQEHNAARYAGWLPGWRNRRTRRRALAAWLVCAVATLVVGLFAGDLRGAAFFAWWGLLVITVVLQMLNKVLTNNIGERSARLLDERELALRGRCGYVGFLVAVLSMVIAAMVLASTPLSGAPFGSFVLLVSLVALVSNVPTGLLAWQLPDDEPDPIAEGEHRG